MKQGDKGQYRSFIEEKLVQSFMVVFVGMTVDDEYKFRINSNEGEHLTIARNCFPKHKWKGGMDGTLELSTVIEMY